MKRLKSMNYWSKQVDSKFPHSAQAVLRQNSAVTKGRATASPCGQGSCNCGGGCNVECGGE